MYKVLGSDGKEYGPVTADQLREWAAQGRANGQTMVQADGTTGWKALGTVPELAGLVGGAPAGALPPIAPQPPAPARAATAPIPNYLVQSILCTLFCCLPFGIAAIVYASQVNSKQMAGDIAGALASSKKAKTWCWASLIGWVAAVLVYVVFIAVMVAAGKFRPH
jgi:hypothetical protein